MILQEEKVMKTTNGQNVSAPKQVDTSKKVTDHLANERTFLAWIRTGLATIAFGFVVERFGPLLSSFSGICLAALGVIMMIVALLEFLHNRHSINAERFHSSTSFPIILTILASLVGVILAIYLFRTG